MAVSGSDLGSFHVSVIFLHSKQSKFIYLKKASLSTREHALAKGNSTHDSDATHNVV